MKNNSYRLTDYQPTEQEEYERRQKEIREDHLRRVRRGGKRNWRPCLHDTCPECHGTGIKLDGTPCVHWISCPKCSPMTLFCLSEMNFVCSL
jgi:hypothetical protein